MQQMEKLHLHSLSKIYDYFVPSIQKITFTINFQNPKPSSLTSAECWYNKFIKLFSKIGYYYHFNSKKCRQSCDGIIYFSGFAIFLET